MPAGRLEVPSYTPIAAPAPPPPVAEPAGVPVVAPRVLLVAGALIALGLLPWISGLAGALILGVVTGPLHRRLSRHLPERLSAALLALAVVLLVVVAGSWLLATTLGEATEALRALQGSNVLARLSRLRFGGLDLARQVEGVWSALLAWLSGQALALFGSATRATLNLAIALFGLYYLLLDGLPLGRRAAALLGIQPALARLLRMRFVAVTDALLIGTILTAATQGLLVGLGFWAVGLRGPVLWGVVTACVSVLPVFGSALVWGPGVIVLAASHRFGAALALALLGAIVVANIDNLVRLVAFRRISGIHPMLTLVGAFAGVGIFGIAGVLIGPLLLSYFFELLRLHEASLTSRGDAPGRVP